jgi:SAM-dependent methyltransferase
MMSIPERLVRVQKSFRKKRMQRFGSVFSFSRGLFLRQLRILDVGGTAEIWALLPLPEASRVVLLNMPRAGEGRKSAAAGLEYVHGDGCHLPFADQAFDIVFSNSVIEHVGGPDAQERFALEVARAGRGYWVQTPNRYFPIETHLLMPMVHLLPRAWRAFIVRRFTVWQWINRPAADEKRFYIEHFVSDIRLLSAGDMQRLFPDAVILRERFLMFTKSLIAYRAPE